MYFWVQSESGSAIEADSHHLRIQLFGDFGRIPWRNKNCGTVV